MRHMDQLTEAGSHICVVGPRLSMPETTLGLSRRPQASFLTKIPPPLLPLSLLLCVPKGPKRIQISNDEGERGKAQGRESGAACGGNDQVCARADGWVVTVPSSASSDAAP